MMHLKYIGFIICFGILFLQNDNSLFAQHVKKDSIKTIKIYDKKRSVSSPATQTLDSNFLLAFNQHSLNQILQWHSNVFVKNYGAGNLSTISIRGSSAAQTTVLWHSININNAMSGLSDFSAMPTALFDMVDIAYGNMQNNQSVSGSISLLNESPKFIKQKKIKAALAYESLYNVNANAKFHMANNKFCNTLKLNVNADENRYSFYNDDENSEDTLRHAQTKSLHILDDFYYKPNLNNTVSFHLWTFQRERQIPPASFELVSVKHEQNKVFRSLVKWERLNFYNLNLVSTIGFITEQYQYHDTAIQVHNHASVQQFPLSIKSSYSPKSNHFFVVEATASNANLLSQSNANMFTAGLQASYRIDNILKKLSIKASLKKELNSIFYLPYAFHFLSQYKLGRALDIYASVSTNYRMPTLNELYFIPGGNKNLKPERSKNIEGGIHFNKLTGKFHFQNDIAFYNRQVNDWILWYGSSIFTPHNIQEVHSRGIEYMMNFELLFASHKAKNTTSLIEIQQQSLLNSTNQNLKLIGGILYAYTLSTSEGSTIPNDYSIGKQIPYVPRYQMKAHVGLKNNLGELTYFHTYTGYRFITTDETQYLEPYQTGNLMFIYKFKIQTIRSIFSAKCLNIFNTNYQSITGRYMPRRNWSVAMNFEF